MTDPKPNALELANQGNPRAIALFMAEKLGTDIDVQAGVKEDILLIRLIIDGPIEKDLALLEKIENVLDEINCTIFDACKVQAVMKTDMKPIWVHSLSLQKNCLGVEEAISANTSLDVIPDEVDFINTEISQPIENNEISQPYRDDAHSGKWKIPGIGFGNLHKLSGQISEQTLRIAQEAATTTQDAAFKATEQAMRSSINQTMNAFQIAVEEIHSRKLPAKMTALTGTINVGVIQLSIRLDIPMDEETGEIRMEVS